MKEIPLTQKQKAQVSDEDYPKVKGLKWTASRIGDKWYATKSFYNEGKKSTISLHRFLTGAGSDERVVFKDGNPLNCQRNNMIKVKKFYALLKSLCLI